MIEQTFRGRYEVSDGYVSGSRPKFFVVNLSDLPIGATDEELLTFYEECAQEHFEQNVTQSISREDEFLEWARSAICARLED